jgi:hypothetical protein
MFDFTELVKRAIKYLIEGLAVAICAYAIPKKQLNVEEIELNNSENDQTNKLKSES